MSDKLCRWGILGAAVIARKNWKAILNAGNGVVAAVASRSLDRSRQFVAECQAEAPFPQTPQALGSYEELLSRDDIDAVYIPLPTGVRKQWVIRAAEAGKHVMCEKPCAIDADDLREMVEACRRHNVQFMDGVMFMHSRRLEAMRETLSDGESVGRIKRIAMQFSFYAPAEFHEENIRAHSELEPLGCLGDLGWYTIRFALWAMNYRMPERVTSRLLTQSGRPDSPNSVPMELSAEMLFPEGASASFYCSFVTENQQWAHISGEKGFLHVRDFVLPFFGCETSFDTNSAVFHVEGCEFNMEDHTRRHQVREYSNDARDSQETCLFRKFGDLALGGQVDDHWPEISLKTQRVMDACIRSARADGEMQTEF